MQILPWLEQVPMPSVLAVEPWPANRLLVIQLREMRIYTKFVQDKKNRWLECSNKKGPRSNRGRLK